VDRIAEKAFHGHFQQQVEEHRGRNAVKIRATRLEEFQVRVLRLRRELLEGRATRFEAAIDRPQRRMEQLGGRERR